MEQYRSIRRLFKDGGAITRLVWDLLRIALAVFIIWSLLFGLTGLSTPFIAVSSDSMAPNIKTGDLVVISALDKNPPAGSEKGVVTVYEVENSDVSHSSFGKPGSVISFNSIELSDKPVIHRAHLWVEEGENWVDRADPNLLGNHTTCDDITSCPAPNDGFITAGDNNNVYDQAKTDEPPVEINRIRGVAELRAPYLGWVRMGMDEIIP